MILPTREVPYGIKVQAREESQISSVWTDLLNDQLKYDLNNKTADFGNVSFHCMFI